MTEAAFDLDTGELPDRVLSGRRAGNDDHRGDRIGAAALTSGVLPNAAALVGVHMLETALLLGSWICVGSGALSGRLDYGWLAAWALALLSMIPLHALSTWLQGVVAVGFGGILKQRMLDTAISGDGDLDTAKAAGRSLSEALDTVALDDLATNGGIASLLASIELLVAPALLYWGGGSILEFAVLALWDVLTIALINHNLRLRYEWTQRRLALTHRLIDNMTAQRTRVAQQAPAAWHDGEDAAVERYLRVSKSLDESTARIETALPRGYLIVSVLALAPGFVMGTAAPERLAIAIGVILFAKTAFERLCFGFSRPATAWIAWQCVKPAVEAAGGHTPARDAPDGLPGIPVLHARDLAFYYPGQSHPVLTKCSLSLRSGDQVLLEGPSGCGKSTLADILAGIRRPTGGCLQAGGWDHPTLGDPHWRRRIALIPRCRDNHLFCAPLIFNLLLGRPLPATAEDEAEADALCRELGLGALLARMPDGIHQVVGDGAWLLSHGERSRIFLARALLQRAEVLILDEHFAALDADTLRQCLECLARRAQTLIVMMPG